MVDANSRLSQLGPSCRGTCDLATAVQTVTKSLTVIVLGLGVAVRAVRLVLGLAAD
jgi:hypothetical protein